MKGLTKRVFDMLGRLVVFARTYPQYFGKDTVAGRAMADIEMAVEGLSGHDTSLADRHYAMKLSIEDRVAARKLLRDFLETISRTAKGLRLAEFSMPRGRSDVTLVSVGKLWALRAEPVRQQFVDYGLPADFLARLNAAIGDVQRAIEEQALRKGRRLETEVAMAETRISALSALERLDPVVLNLLRDNPPVLAVWKQARRVGKPARVAPNEAPPEDGISASA